MRHPGRTATTASALMIGVALVTVVTVIAQGLRDTTSRHAREAHRRDARDHGRGRLVADRPGDRRGRRRAPGIDGVTAIRQDVGLAFGDKEIVNSIDPATADGRFSSTSPRGRATRCRSSERWRDRRRRLRHRAPPRCRRSLLGHLRQGRQGPPAGGRDREVAGARRPWNGPDHDLSDARTRRRSRTNATRSRWCPRTAAQR